MEKYNSKFLNEEFGIIDMREETGFYYIPNEYANTSDTLYTGDEAIIYDFEFDNLEVNDNDVIAVNVWEQIDTYTFRLIVINCTNLTEGSFIYKGSLMDDGRHYLINTLANRFRTYKNVLFTMYLLYTEEETYQFVDTLLQDVEELDM